MNPSFLEAEPVLLAPMAGVLNLPLRLALRQFGWTTSWIGSIDAGAVVAAGDGRLINILGRVEPIATEESPLVVQLLGNDVGALSEAMALLEDRVDAFDINLGCPLPQVTRKGLGASLLEEPSRTTDMIRRLAVRTRRPLTAKIRITRGVRFQETVRFAEQLESAGVAALVVHARTADQGFSGPPDWTAIRVIRDRLSIPVIANGGIGTAPDVMSCQAQTLCSSVMVGAGAIRNPFLALEYERLAHDEPPPKGGGSRLADFAAEYGRRLAGLRRTSGPLFTYPLGYLGYLILRIRIMLFVGRH